MASDTSTLMTLWLFVSFFTTPMCFWAVNRLHKAEAENKRLKAVLEVSFDRERQWRAGITPPMPQG